MYDFTLTNIGRLRKTTTDILKEILPSLEYVSDRRWTNFVHTIWRRQWFNCATIYIFVQQYVTRLDNILSNDIKKLIVVKSFAFEFFKI